MEVEAPDVPRCRRKEENIDITKGHLHAGTCKNYTQESVDIIAKQTWHNRNCIISYYDEVLLSTKRAR